VCADGEPNTRPVVNSKRDAAAVTRSIFNTLHGAPGFDTVAPRGGDTRQQCRPEGRANGALAQGITPPRTWGIYHNIYYINKNICKHFINDLELKYILDKINVYKVEKRFCNL
jgi:hypothetical protein